VRAHLLDVNVLVALGWARHADHEQVIKWFREEGQRSFALCTVTEAGFVRAMTNPTIVGGAVPMEEPREILARLADLKGYQFWPLQRRFAEMTLPFEQRLHGYRQVTDAVLLGLAIERKGTLATLDQAIRHLAGNEFAQYVTLIG
jgi:uncharacterized protein